jgi:tetratricopeptide (TPR) repeat protein
LADALAAPGTVTLRGPPGVGKSRLAATAARAWHARHGGEGWLCDVSEARSEAGLVSAVARTLDVPLGQADPVAQLARAIGSRGPVVLVLDNFERVAHLAGVIDRWRSRAPEARLVVTSRIPLDLVDQHVVDVDVLDPASAKALIATRARARGVDVADDPELAELAKRLDGLPLALELAAGRLGVLTVRDVLERLGLSLLRGSTDDRHGTLQAALDWSSELLTGGERAGLLQLSVFVGGFTLASAEEVLDLPDGARALEVVEALLEQSWLTAHEGRLGMLGPVRAYAEAGLQDGGRAAARHGVWVTGLRDGLGVEGSTRRLRSLQAELENIVAACRRAVARRDGDVALDALEAALEVLRQTGPASASVALAEAVHGMTLGPLLHARARRCLGEALYGAGRLDEAMVHVEAALRALRGLGSRRDEGLVRVDLANLHQDQGRTGRARVQYDRALVLLRASGDRRSEGTVRSYLGNAAVGRGRVDQARADYEAALAIHREVGDRRSEGVALGNLGIVCRGQGREDEARAYYDAALAIHREVGDRRSESHVLCNLANLAQLQGRVEDARARFDDALRVQRQVGDRRFEAIVLGNLGNFLHRAQLPDEALAHYEAALAAHREVGSPRYEANVLGNLGTLHAQQGRLDEAAAHYDTALAIARRVGDRGSESQLLGYVGHLHRVQGHAAEARRYYEAALAQHEEVGDAGSASAMREFLRTLARDYEAQG